MFIKTNISTSIRSSVDQHEKVKDLSKAMKSSDCNKWQKAMESEIKSMKTNKVWTLVEASKDIKPISCKWVYKKKDWSRLES